MRACRSAVVALCCLFLAGSGAAHAQGFAIRRTATELGVEMIDNNFDFEARPSFRRSEWAQWAFLRLTGHFADPRLANFDVRVRPELRQANVDAVNEESQGIRFVSVESRLRVLQERPFSSSLSHLRSFEVTGGDIGGETRRTTTTYKARMDYRNAYLPLALSYENTNLSQDFRSIDGRLVNDELAISTIRLSGASRKTSVVLERIVRNDRIAAGDFSIYRARFQNRHRWGKGSRAFSTFEYYAKLGDTDFREFSWNESTHIQHLNAVFSEHNYRLAEGDVSGERLASRVADSRLGWQGRRGTNLSLGASYRSNTRPGGFDRTFRVAPRLQFRFKLPGNGTLRVGGYAGYEGFRVRSEGQGTTTVISEQHVVGQSGTFFLDNPSVLGGTVVITRTNAGLVLEEGFDYRLNSTGTFTEVVLVAGGRLLVGDTVLVDYSFMDNVEQNSKSIVSNLDVSAGMAGVTVYVRTLRRDPFDGGDQARGLTEGFTGRRIVDLDQLTYGVNWNAYAGPLQFSAAAEKDRRTDDLVDVDATSVRVLMSYRAFRALTLSINGGINRNSGSFEPLRVRSVGATLNWTPHRTLSIRGILTAWDTEQNNVTTQDLIGGGVDFTWRPGLLFADFRYRVNQTDVPLVKTEHRATFRLSRAF